MSAVRLSNHEEMDVPPKDNIDEEKEDKSELDNSEDRKMPAAKLSHEKEIDPATNLSHEKEIDEPEKDINYKKIDENLGPQKSDDIVWPEITKGVEGIMYNVFQAKLPFDFNKYINLPNISSARQDKVTNFFKKWTNKLASVRYDRKYPISGNTLRTLKVNEVVDTQIIKLFYTGIHKTLCLFNEAELEKGRPLRTFFFLSNLLMFSVMKESINMMGFIFMMH